MSDPKPGGGGGLFDSLKGLAASLIAIVHTRLDLLSTELEEERARLASVLVMLFVALFCIGIGVVLLVFLIVVAFWESHRLLALAGLTAFFLVGGATAIGFARHRLRTKPKLFAASLAELSKDREHLVQRS
ncbi:MAG: phage holin family protein [Proteobacteria bacterium]|nr:phage holin family protein [Pseudomonadota bacterium]MBS0329229.1 phage holin family protein [Pseudomonadota bacterium]